MISHDFSLTLWSYGLAALAYSAFACHLLRIESWRSNRPAAATALLAAVLSSALWGWLGAALVLTREPWFAGAAALADLLRYGCWFACLLLLLRPRQHE